MSPRLLCNNKCLKRGISILVKTEIDLFNALALCNTHPDKMVFIEMIMKVDDVPPLLATEGKAYSDGDKYYYFLFLPLLYNSCFRTYF